MKTLIFFSILFALLSLDSVSGHDITIKEMESYGRDAASGNIAAIDKIDQVYSELYKNIDYSKEHDRVISNLLLMRAAFNAIASSVQSGETDPAFQALVYATGKPNLAPFTSSAFGIAAAAGNRPSLDILLNYKKHGLLLSSAVEGLIPAAAKNIKDAVKFLERIIQDDSKKSLWLMASQGLVAAANAGDADAKAALDKYSASTE